MIHLQIILDDPVLIELTGGKEYTKINDKALHMNTEGLKYINHLLIGVSRPKV